MLYQKHRNIQSFPQNSSGRSLSCWEWSNSDEIISKSVGVMALGDRVRSHRVGICEFILLYLCLFGCINKPYKCGNCNLYGFISFIFASTAWWCSVQLCTKHGCDCVVPNWECPFGGAMFLHLEPRRFYSHNDGVIFQELLSRCDLLTGTFKVVNPKLCTNHVPCLFWKWNDCG